MSKFNKVFLVISIFNIVWLVIGCLCVIFHAPVKYVPYYIGGTVISFIGLIILIHLEYSKKKK